MSDRTRKLEFGAGEFKVKTYITLINLRNLFQYHFTIALKTSKDMPLGIRPMRLGFYLTTAPVGHNLHICGGIKPGPNSLFPNHCNS